MIAYGTREFYPVAEQKAKAYFDEIKEYVFEDEETLCCFAHDEAVALFTNRRRTGVRREAKFIYSKKA